MQEELKECIKYLQRLTSSRLLFDGDDLQGSYKAPVSNLFVLLSPLWVSVIFATINKTATTNSPHYK